MKTPEEIIDEWLTARLRYSMDRGQPPLPPPLMEALDAAGYAIVPKAFPRLAIHADDHYVGVPSAFLSSNGKPLAKP